ncbi:hypothetical protein P3X46_001392, partial [Hevea brasiliensis]
IQICIRRKITVPEPAEVCIRRQHSLCTFPPPLCTFTELCITYAPSHALCISGPELVKSHKGLHNLCTHLCNPMK